ncbi:MAG: SAM-dependent methyltransferase [Bacillus sp. (in: Bacteria)]|nr:SAM-dependent methyltransferase [Bacillus sp. (in: firmicutes)]
MKNNDAEIYDDMSYLIIEASPYHQQILLNNLREYKEKINVYTNVEKAQSSHPLFEGIVFSNELIDAFPVNVVEKRDGDLYEVMINWGDGSFIEELVPIQNSRLSEWLRLYGPELPEAHRTEICLSMETWMLTISNWLKRGVIVTVDYGYSNEELVKPERREGSLRGYSKHQMIKDPLMNPGEMDLTAHIQWDAFRKISRANGMVELFHDKQDRFLIKAGLFSFLNNAAGANPFSEEFKENRAIQSLVHPGGISSSFHVNIQGKSIKMSKEYNLFIEDPYGMNR